jgi:hypothetical protein
VADANGRSGLDEEVGPVRPGVLSALLQEMFASDATPEARWSGALRPGTVIGRFELVREVGRGGFGVVYEAKDRELGRTVAFKAVLPGDRPDVAEDRLLREAEAAARLSHPNIVTIHDVGRSEFGPYLILELLHGNTLARRLQLGQVPFHEALRIGLAVARGLAHAHAHGVVHRDLTPGNVFLCDDGQVKLLDLGMAHAFGRRKLEGGTPAYMAPEQWSGAPEDERTDVFSLGVVLYRMLAGELPFPDDKGRSVQRSRPAPPLKVPDEPGLSDLVARMLQKDPVRRPRDAGEVLVALRTFEQELQRSDSAPTAATVRVTAARRSRRRALLALAAVAAGMFVAWYAHRESRTRWALQEALPQVALLAEQGKFPAAVALASKVEEVAPHDPRLARLWPEISRLVRIETAPPGADVYVKEYSATGSTWRHLGQSPVHARLPLVLHRLRIEKEGFARIEAVPKQPFSYFGRAATASSDVFPLRFGLDRADAVPGDMVHVPGDTVPGLGLVGIHTLELPGFPQVPPVQLGDYLIDRTEVTNRQFKAFLDAGGYRRRELWQHEFVKDGRVLSWEGAMDFFRDRTGRPGPATWVSGQYPEGKGDLPVTGVSWYEAAAYAAYAGKSLPNVYQWSRAAGLWASGEILPLSNFGREKGLAPVGSHDGVGPFGTVDMAGNAKEWCWNSTEAGRYILGGAWDETPHMFIAPDAQSPFARGANYGFRLVKQLDDRTAPAASQPVAWRPQGGVQPKPVSAEVFRIFKRMYAYDKLPLNLAAEVVDDGSEGWRREKVSFAAAYGDERVIAHVFTPRNVAPPFQTIVFFPGASAIVSRSSDQFALMWLVRPVVSSGRALVYPVYKSTYERGDALKSPAASPSAFYRDHVLEWSKDLGRTIDYIETRPDLDARRIALYGVSWGAKLLPLLAAVEERVRVGIMVGGGLGPLDSTAMPEADPFNFAPHVRQPILMVNGRYDFTFPLEGSQRPLFDQLGSPAQDKRHVVFDTGHVPPNDLLTKEVLDWLDRYLGPVH